MPATCTILYPRSAEVNLDYYLNHHMRLASKLFDTSILISWEVFALPTDAPYSVQADITWASIEACEAALGSEKGQLMHDDVKNYSREKPVVLFRESIGRSH
ncbi:hypothetical protein BJY04DRAFT_186215 [Aspergillus karnatakaensis]|uniref:uncharacterized protein n=1 Tax=Aspergillus karnatakaensis TaxID=1810916 RepID=UPI003CCE2CC9